MSATDGNSQFNRHRVRAQPDKSLVDEVTEQTAALVDDEATERVLVVYNEETADIYVEQLDHVAPPLPEGLKNRRPARERKDE